MMVSINKGNHWIYLYFLMRLEMRLMTTGENLLPWSMTSL